MALGNKEIMAKNIKKYMAIKGVNQTEMCNALGFKFMTLSDWLHAKTYPRIDKIELMANYFGVSKADLVEEHADDEQHYYLDDDAREMAEFMHKNPNYKVLFDAVRNVSAEDIEFVRQMIDRTTNNN
jgi:transcriptional regulator with XRE-family HTH domain